MKAHVLVAAMGLALSIFTLPALGADILPPQATKDADDPIRDRSGAILLHPHISDFDGAEFTVEHDGGIARVPYDAMPLAYRRFFMPDPERAKEEADRRKKLVDDAQRQAILEVQRGLLERQMRAKAEAKRSEVSSGIRYGPTYDLPTAYTSREANDPAKPMRFEITIKQGVLTELFPLGGPLMSLELVAVDEDAVAVRRSRHERTQSVQVRHGREAEGQNLTWLYSDKSGTSIYWLDTLRRPPESGIFVIEYSPQSPLRPGSPVREQMPQAPKQP
jgi:hypothetical protein